MPGSDLPLLVEAAQEAGEIARRFHQGAPAVWEKEDAQGPVTEADLAVDAHLKDRLLTARPDYGWLSEESVARTDRTATSAQFIVDPIDGTRAFLEGGRDWSHSIAVARGGQITAAVVYLPLRSATYTAVLGEGAWLNDARLGTSDQTEIERAQVLANAPTMDQRHWHRGAPGFERHFRSSLAYRMCLVALGRFDAMLTLRPTWEWDVAAGSLIVTEAGGTVTDQAGHPLRFNNPIPQHDGVVAAGGAMHRALMDRLARDR
ncbi:inositol monophosphatase family protein [Histidinibacterium aquaticum]|uniref:inositol monophosphatase family protein n=1 Tax=Histidinibacterium aquaticum TaxID=2613962 RepID=UPI001CC39D98|nr:3'(2'),5'-bisphosphate nucleotidase CysQ [Histidinibacterium aquaticum]